MIIFLFADFKTGGSQKIAIDVFNELIKYKPHSIVLSINNKGNLKKKFINQKKIYNLGYKRVIYSVFSLFSFLNKKKTKYSFLYTATSWNNYIFFKFISKKKSKNYSKRNKYF